MKFTLPLAVSAAIATIFTLASCSDRDASRIEVDPGFSAYVSAFTSGLISNSNTIKVVLVDDVQGAEPGQLVSQNSFDFEPSIDGEAYWLDERTIEFRPTKPLPSGTSYIANFELSNFMEVPDEFEELEFGFTVINQSLFVSFEGLRSIDASNYMEFELYGTVRTSDMAAAIDIEKCLFADQEGEKLSIKWEHGEVGKSHKFTVTGVRRTEDEQFVELSWDGEPINADVDDDMEIRIPPKGEFSLIQVATLRNPGLHFSLQFSDPVDRSQNLKGLVYLMSGNELRLTVNDNEIKAYPINSIKNEETLVVAQDLKRADGNTLLEEFRRVVQFNLEKPAVELIGDGVIMPSNGQINFPFKAINLKGVNLRVIRIFEHNVHQFFQQNQLNNTSELTRVGRVIYDQAIDLITNKPVDFGVWNNFSVDLSEIIKTEPGAIYRVMISFERYQSLYPCSDEYGDPKPFKKLPANWDDNSYYNMSRWYDEDYNWSDKENPCTPSYYMYHDRVKSTNIFASNLGIIAKEAANNKYEVVVTDLRNTDQLSGVEVQAYNYQKQLLGTTTTNSDGLAQLKLDNKAFLLVAKRGDDFGYLKVDNGSSLSMSLFSINGYKTQRGVKAFLYAERGVWRPGDTIHLSVMVEDKQKALPPKYPVVVELYDPLGKLYDKTVSSDGLNGLYRFKLKTTSDDVTGTWRAKVSVGNSVFEKNLKIETIKPNRIRIGLDAGGEIIEAGSSVNIDLDAQWLYGAPASNMKARTEVSFSNTNTVFKGYEDYQFDDRSRNISTDDIFEREVKTDATGKAKFSLPLPQGDDFPGMLKMNMATKVFEDGGDFSQDFTHFKFSPYQSYVGVKMAGGSNWLSALDSQEPQPISIAALDAKGNALSKEVMVELYKIEWNWWYESDENELNRYINRSSENMVFSDYVYVEDGKTIYNLEFPEPDWGKYAVRVVDPSSGHSTMETFFVSWRYWRSQGEGAGDAATMIALESDKENYKVGEDIEINLPSGGEGKIYVSIEKGDQILDRFWVDAASGSTTFKIEATEEMAPNAYVSATLIQPHNQQSNDLPIRMYGILPVMVYDEATILEPMIAAPEEITPESDYTIRVSEKNDRNMTYTVAVVDEGLLSLTRFKTPSPWSWFYAKEALATRTWDMYKYVMSAETGNLNALLAIGGDENLEYKEDQDANRFEPVVDVLGPFELDGGENEHTLHIGNYIGAVRVMVVAGHDGAYGEAEKEIKVNQPLMVLTTLPRVLGPSEKVRIPVTVMALEDGLGTVKVQLKTNDLLLPKALEKSVTINKAGESTVYFDCDVAFALGIAKLEINASSANEKAHEELEVEVRPPNPVIIDAESKMLAAGESWQNSYSGVGIRGTNTANLQVSRIPDLNMDRHLKYLIRYPHGCIEQTTSSVFPQLYLSRLMELTDEQEREIEKNITAGVNRLRKFQTSQGGFAYWPGNVDASTWGTNYAGHFMLEARENGYALPSGMLDQWVKFQKQAVGSWRRSESGRYHGYGSDLTQAYRLYTLAVAGEGDIGAMNRLKADQNLGNKAAWRLAAAYAVMGRMDVANELSNRSYTFDKYREMGGSYGSDIRDMAMVMETMSYLENKEKMLELMRDIASALKDGWHSTQTRAYALLAISKVVDEVDDSPTFSFKATINNKTIDFESEAAVVNLPVEKDYLMSGDVSVANTSGGPLFISFVRSGIPVESNANNREDDLRMSIVYTNTNGSRVDPVSIAQGEDFNVNVTVTHPGIRGDYEEVALSQIFPSGWQIVNTRVGDDNAVTSEGIEYQDIRDDRVYTYFDLGKGESLEFSIKLNATYVGRYYLPSVFCAPMYDESVQAQLPGRWVEVVE